MPPLCRILHVVASVVALLAAGCSGGPGRVTLAEAGRPRAAIVVAPDATDAEREAAAELARVVEVATGARLAVGTAARPGDAVIRVGLGAAPPEVRARVERLPGEGFVIDVPGGGPLALAGNAPDGTYFAVCEFLERCLGVRWLWPGPLGEVVPRAGTLRVARFHAEESPAFLWRSLGPGGALWGPNDKWTQERLLGVSEAHQRDQRLWERHNRFGGLRIYGGHSFGEILPPATYGAEHPEYFALVKGRRDCNPAGFDGKHGRQPCTTNPDVIRLAVAYCDGFFADHPDYDAVSISLNDGGGFCECDRCRAMDRPGAGAAGGDPEGGGGGDAITDRVVTFANQVAAQVVRLHPGKKLLLFAYGRYRTPMRVAPHPALIIQYCLHAHAHWQSGQEACEYGECEAWSRAASNLGVYEYHVQGAHPDLPRLYTPLVERSVRRLHAMGFRHYQTQAGDGHALNGLTYYVLGRLLWNPAVDAAAVRRDAVERGFGTAAPAVLRWMDRLESAWKDRGKDVSMNGGDPETYRRVLALYSPELRDACRRDLDDALAAAGGAECDRVRFLQRGWRYVDLTADAAAASLTAAASPDARGRMLDAWRARDAYVESLKDDFVLAYFWIKYNDVMRTFNPLGRAGGR